MKNKAFTLIELFIVIAIISIVLALILPAMAKAKQRSDELKAKNSQVQLANSIQQAAAMANFTDIIDETPANNSNIHLGDLVMIKGINIIGVVNRDTMGYFGIITTNALIGGPNTAVTSIEGISPEILIKLPITNSIKTNIVQVENSKE